MEAPDPPDSGQDPCYFSVKEHGIEPLVDLCSQNKVHTLDLTGFYVELDYFSVFAKCRSLKTLILKGMAVVGCTNLHFQDTGMYGEEQLDIISVLEAEKDCTIERVYLAGVFVLGTFLTPKATT